MDGSEPCDDEVADFIGLPRAEVADIFAEVVDTFSEVVDIFAEVTDILALQSYPASRQL